MPQAATAENVQDLMLATRRLHTFLVAYHNVTGRPHPRSLAAFREEDRHREIFDAVLKKKTAFVDIHRVRFSFTENTCKLVVSTTQDHQFLCEQPGLVRMEFDLTDNYMLMNPNLRKVQDLNDADDATLKGILGVDGNGPPA